MSAESIDHFMDALERMIDAQDDMWEEEKYSNHNLMLKIKDERYDPAREDAKRALIQFIREEISRLS